MCVSFPSLYALAISKKVWVAGSMDLDTRERSLEPCFSKPLNDWEVDNVEDLFSRLQREALDNAGKDKVVWMT